MNDFEEEQGFAPKPDDETGSVTEEGTPVENGNSDAEEPAAPAADGSNEEFHAAQPQEPPVNAQQQPQQPSGPFYGQPYPPYAGQYQNTRPYTPPTYSYNNQTQPFYTPGQYPNQAQFGQPISPPPTKGKKKGLIVFFSILGALIIFATSVAAIALHFSGNSPAVDKSDGDTKTTTSDGPSLVINNNSSSSQTSSQTGALTTVQVAEKVKPSVVGILVYSNSTNISASKQAAGEGSGIVMGTDKTGKYTYIITCAHVISDSNVSISIQVENGTQYKAEIVGYDVRTDIGVLKVKATGLKAAEFGNSDNIKVGEQVFAIGNPGGTEFFGSFTSGVVSAIDRPVSSEIGYTMECIQHDAAINPGNSGGALVNTSGQVVGINSLKIADTNYEGMGFAIPITSAKTIVDNIIKFGYVPNRPKLGITYLPVSANQIYSMIVQIKGLPAGSLYINAISSDSALANTKAKAGDIIIKANGKNLDTANVLLEIIDKGKVGDTVTLTICRVGNNYQTTEFDVKVKLVEDKGNVVPSSSNNTETTTNPFDNWPFP